MWKIRLILAGVILMSGLWAYPFARNVMSERGRVYKESEQAQSRYIGIGEVYEQVAEQIMVNPRGEGKVIFERVENRAKYPVEQYEITTIPAQSALKYAVGRVLWWERIQGSSDEYLVLYTGHGLSKYRVGYEQTGVSVEVAGYPNKLERIKIDGEQSTLIAL